MSALLHWLLRRWRIWVSVTAVLAIYGAAGFFWAPHLARNIITNFIEKDLGRHVSIARLRFNPFTFTARVDRFALTESDGAPIAKFAALTVNAELSSIVHRAITLKELSVEEPDINVIVSADGSLNLARLQPPAAKGPAPDSSEGIALRIGILTIRRGRLHLEDHSHPKSFATELKPIEFELTDFRTEPKFENAYRFAATTEDDERLEWSGQFSISPLGSSGEFKVNGLKATTIAEYLQDKLPFDLRSGHIDILGKYQLALQERLTLKAQLPTVSVHDVAIAARGDNSSPWITVPELTISESSLSLTERTVGVAKISIVDAHVEIVREADGGLNLVRLLPTESATSQAAPNDATTSWQVDVGNVAIERAILNVEDRTVTPNAKFAIAPLNVTVTGYSSKPDTVFGVASDLGINEQGHLVIDGHMSLAPPAMEFKIALRDFDLPPLQGFVAAATDMTLETGRVSAQSTLRYAAEPKRGQAQIKFSGDIQIDDLLTKDNALQEDFIKWRSLKFTGVEFQHSSDQPALRRLNIARIQAQRPYGRVIIGSDGTVNAAHVLNPKRKETAAAPVTEPAPAQQPLPIRIRTIVIDDGATSFADYSVKPSFAAEIGDLKGTIDGLSSAGDSRAQVQLSGSVDRYAPVAITGVINPLASDVFSDIALSFRNMELTLFNPYSGKFAGYNITKGKLTTELQYKIEHRRLEASHHIVVDQLEFGAATESKDAVSLPIKLAVALLKDRHGVINLDLPVNGSLDDPEFRIGPIVWQVLKNTLDKIVTAPFKLLGSLFGGGEELAFVEFSPGVADLGADQSAKLGKLKRAMAERPQLKLDIPLQTSAAADSDALAHATLEQAIALLLQGKTDRLAALTAIYVREFGKPPAYPEIADKKADIVVPHTRFLEDALLAKFAPAPAQIEELARRRGVAVQDFLLSGGELSAERIFLSNRGSEPAKNNAVVQMELKLE